ncbi:CRE-TAG-229 protein [Caenorhabditis remanei]|uniref:CRE-TAG-229 protein n=1 Tax=Caenorhabditis remanei TaxID=31234 RepID=E3LLQ0_CAERE|nr:CRE-TAG-229 protein [Caenorhabditis remanei]
MEIKPEFIFIGILILVPAQWFLSPSETGHLKYHLNSLLSTVKEYIPSFLMSQKDPEAEAAESKAMEEEMNPAGNGAYGMGQYIRQRAPEVEFRVGDVVFHPKLEFRGVIIGWDEQAIAPEKYIKVAHGDNKHFSTQPNYAVLIDTRDRFTPQMSYIVQENLRLEKGTIWHPLVDKFFEGFDEQRQKYILRPIYKKWYPDD